MAGRPELHLHNTLTRRKERFEPIDPTRVRMYVCGPTVYQRIHIGNARPLVVFDVLFRLLCHLYGPEHVVYVRNITDIDDKIINQARANGESIAALTERTTVQFHADAEALGCLPPTHEPRATEHVPAMIAMIEELIAQGHAYEAEGHVLFHVPSMPGYGRLSGRDREEQVAGARVEVAPYKRDPADFVLWKPSPDDLPGWDSPWGRGRPGWHIECSAMSEHFLAPLPFDIHGGGLDLIFPHHENEIAQSCCARGVDRMARFWLHNGFVDMRGEKMAKSLGNVVRVDEALAQYPGEVIRFWMLGTQYRSPVDYTGEALAEAKRTLDRFYLALDKTKPEGDADPSEEMIEALADDLNTPAALAALHDLLTDLNVALMEDRAGDAVAIARELRASGRVLGLLEDEPRAFLHAADRIEQDQVRRIEELVAERVAARRARQFARADAIRQRLWEEMRVIVEDRPDGTTDWRRA